MSQCLWQGCLTAPPFPCNSFNQRGMETSSQWGSSLNYPNKNWQVKGDSVSSVCGNFEEKFSKVLMKQSLELCMGHLIFLEYIFSACLSPNISIWLWIAEHISILSLWWDGICVITGCKWQHKFVLIMCFQVMSCRHVAATSIIVSVIFLRFTLGTKDWGL